MAEFHFLRPFLLALLPVGIWLAWQLLRGRGDGGGWRSVVDAPLRAHVLAAPEVLRESRWPLVAGVVACVLAALALAGPAWERLPVPAFRSDEALVVALDLSRSMDAADLSPTRLARAKLKLLDLLERRAAGQTALVVFSTHAFTVTPLTTDTRTIASLVAAVNTDIMPTQGSSLAAGLTKAATLLEQTGSSRGEILVISDADVADADVELARELRRKGFRVSVLAVGTEQGAPIGQPEGGFLTDDNGEVVIPQLDPAALQKLAAAGGGRFARLASDDRDLTALFPAPSALPVSGSVAEGSEQHEADVWRDRGSWLAVALLPLLALSFRRGWIAMWLVVLLAPGARAEAFEWPDLWQRSDQRGYEALQSNQAERAAALFKDPQWRGAAQYRAGKFDDSAATLGGVDSAEGHYNRGNALAKAGHLEEAIAAYDRALELAPDHEDARYNRELVQQYLDKNPQQQNQRNGGQQNQDQQGDSQSSDGGDKPQDGDQSQERQGEQAQDTQSQPQSGQGQGAQDPQHSDEQDLEQAQNAPQPGAPQPSAQPEPAPQDVEQWASDQAAEQWLRRVPQDPGGLLRRKFLYQYQRLGIDQEGRSVLDGERSKPW